jgi:cardiolipin synthase
MSGPREHGDSAFRAGHRLRAGLRRHGVIRRPSELGRLLRSADVQSTYGNSIELYAEGGSGLEAMLRAIEGARRRIHLETYILRGDATGRRFLDAMTERARAGVEVRLLYDGIGSRGLDVSLLEPLRSAGGDAVVFNPLSRLYPRWAPRRRDHRKILVVDGEVAFTGGLNVGDEYLLGAGLDGNPATPWRDAHVRLEGPAVAMLEAVFLESWFRADGPDRPWTGLDGPPITTPEGEAVAVIADGPTYHKRRVRDLLVAALERSRQRARLATPYFVPGRKLATALAETASRGVEVHLLLAGFTDHPLVRWAARGRLPALLASGVRAFEFERSMMHAKVAVFDSSWALIGTSNLDRQSLEHSYEVNLLVEGRALPPRLDDLLAKDMADSREITLAELARRGLLERWRDRLAAFLLARF